MVEMQINIIIVSMDSWTWGKPLKNVFTQLVFTVQLLRTRYNAKHLYILVPLIFATNPGVNIISILQIDTGAQRR